MIPVAVAAGLVLVFIGLLRAFGLVEHSREVIDVSRTSLGVMGDSRLSDDEKEKALQANTIQIFRHFVVLALGGAAALGIPFALVWVADRLGWVRLDDVVAASLSPGFLIVSGVVALGALFLPSRTGRRGATGPFEVEATAGPDDTEPADTASYSGGDRAVHRLAFRTRDAQLAVAGLEDRLFRRRLRDCPLERPVFITGLPRAGTTLLLEILAERPDFASHRYRDMPFLLTPLLWSRVAGRFKRDEELRERTHGDGMMIGPDSPEALEEILWLAFEPDRYRGPTIRPWGGQLSAAFIELLGSHFRKVVLLRSGGAGGGVRYVSKNNLNIARTDALRAAFPDATIIVPFREPTRHATSLLNQHTRFLQIHRRDAFAREYMREIGHFDFGENLRPVDFDGWYSARENTDDGALGFWLEYWVAAYSHLLDHGEGVHLFDYDALVQRPHESLRCLAGTLGVPDAGSLSEAGERLRPPGTSEPTIGDVPEALLARARSLHGELRARALNRDQLRHHRRLRHDREEETHGR